jgi:hypothetical protein
MAGDGEGDAADSEGLDPPADVVEPHAALSSTTL